MRGGDQLGGEAVGEHPLGVVGEDQHRAFGLPAGNRLEDLPAGGGIGGCYALVVRAEELLIAGEEAGLDRRPPSCLHDEREGDRRALVFESRAELGAAAVVADDGRQPDGGAERPQVARDVADATRHRRLALDPQHRDGSLRRDALDRAIDPAVEHDVADAADACPADPLEQAQQIRPVGHASPSSRSNAAHSICPRVMCISWMRAVAREGTTRTGSAIAVRRPPSPPVSAAATQPRCRAAAKPRTTFSLSPEVEMPMHTSPGRHNGLDLSREQPLEAEIVADGGERGGIGGQRQRRDRRAVAAVAYRQFRREMLSVGGAAAVAEEHELAAGAAGADADPEQSRERLAHGDPRRRQHGRVFVQLVIEKAVEVHRVLGHPRASQPSPDIGGILSRFAPEPSVPFGALAIIPVACRSGFSPLAEASPLVEPAAAS